MTKPLRGEVWSVNFEPAIGAEIQKTRPAVVMNPDSIGRLPLRIVVPITDWQPRYTALPWFVHLSLDPSNGLSKASAPDAFQVKSVSETRFVKRLGVLTVQQTEDIADAVVLCVGFGL